MSRREDEAAIHEDSAARFVGFHGSGIVAANADDRPVSIGMIRYAVVDDESSGEAPHLRGVVPGS